jgi:hypothetical protein
MILFFNGRAHKSRMIARSAGMLPALSGILPDSMQRHAACNMKTRGNGPRQHAGGSGRKARVPKLL